MLDIVYSYRMEQFSRLTQQQKFIAIVVAVGLIFVGFWLFSSLRKSGEVRQTTKLKVWGLGDDRTVYEQIFNQFGFPVEYIKKEFSNYEQDLVNALASGDGPDVFMVHNSWLPKHQSKLFPAPEGIMTPLYVTQNFPDVVTTDFVREGKVYALPLSIDTLALFYDKDVFNGAFISVPPSTWGEFEDVALRLTRRDASGTIFQPGVAFGGSARLVDKAADILQVLMIQNGSQMSESNTFRSAINRPASRSVNTAPAVDALRFYLQFADPLSAFYVWDSSQHNSVDAFSYNSSARNKVAMTLNYHYRIPLFLSKNKNLRFGVAQFPQKEGAVGEELATYADYWGFAVSRASKDSELAWRLVRFVTEKNQARNYLKNTGKPPALRALISDYDNDPVLSVFARQILIAKSWVQPGHSDVVQVFSNMIDLVTGGVLSPGEAVTAADRQMDELFSRLIRR